MPAAKKKKSATRTKARRAAPRLPPIKGFMFDLDGTLLLSDRSLGGYQVLPGAVDVLNRLKELNLPFVVLTNGSAYPPPQQAKRLRDIGLPVEDDQMLTPSSVAAEVMSRAGLRRVLVLGERGVGYALEQAGITITFPGETDATKVDGVYVGWHPECNMRDIEAACQAIWGGARLFCASNVPFFATRHGRSMGYSSAIVGAIRHMTHVPMVLTGKPSLDALRFVARRLGVRAREVAVVGDDPGVETVMARRLGAVAFGVTTGVLDEAGWAKERGFRRPHRVLGSIAELLELEVLAR